jgi:Bacterial protein of unknown function (DUF937)
MNTNIVQLITSQLGGGTINKLSSLLGESPEKTQSAVGAAVPTLLAGLTNVASTPEGAQRLASAASQQDPNITSNFASALGSGSGTGSGMLNNLFGGGMLGSLTSVLGRFTGMNTTAVGSLCGVIAPLALGFLGKQQKTMGLDASGLAGFLNSQKQNIASAMPPGLANVLGSVPGFSSFAQKVPAEEIAHAGAGPSYTGSSSGSGRSAAQVEPVTQQEHGFPSRWIITLLVAAAILLGLWAWSHRHPAQTMTEQPTTTMGTSTTQITSGLQDSLTSATTTLSGVTDASTAEQALPQLTQINDKIGTLRAQIDKLPASAKSTALGALQPTVTSLQQLSAKVRGIPGVGDKFQTTLNQFDANLSDLKTNTNP